MEHRGIKYYLLLLLLLTACQQSELDVQQDISTVRSLLQVTPCVVTSDAQSQAQQSATRAVITGTNMAISENTYGLIVCKHEDTPTQYITYDQEGANIYGNIRAWYGNYNYQGIVDWWYSYEQSSGVCFKPFYLITNDVSKHLDIYAYSPWITGTTIQNGAAYALDSLLIGNIPDMMYARENDPADIDNKDRIITNNVPIPLTFHFRHALARIAIHFKLATAQSTGYDGFHAVRPYKYVLLRKETAATPLYTQGKMNIITGEVTPTQVVSQSKQLVVTPSYNYIYGRDGYSIYQSDVWKTFDMLVHPTLYQADGDFSLKFYFDGQNPNQSFAHTYEIKRSDLLHSDGTTYGFQPGYCYHFYFIIDNYIHLQNVVVNTEWELTDEENIKI